MRTLLAIAILLICQPAEAGKKSDARLIQRARSAISQAPVPSNAQGVAYSRELRFSWIPFSPPFGGFVKAGRAVAFDRSCVDGRCQLSNPRFVRSLGGGVTATVGVGLPWSISHTERVIAFRTRKETNDWATKVWVGGHVQAFAAAGIPGKLWIYSVGPTWDNRPGTEVWKRELFVGLFASAGVSAGLDVQWPQKVK